MEQRFGTRGRTLSALLNTLDRQRYGLTKRELMVARLLDEGLSNAELAERLGVSVFTARNHVERLLGKLGVPRRTRVGAVLRGEAA